MEAATSADKRKVKEFSEKATAAIMENLTSPKTIGEAIEIKEVAEIESIRRKKEALSQLIRCAVNAENKEDRECIILDAAKSEMSYIEEELLQLSKKEIIAKSMHKRSADYLKAIKEVMETRLNMERKKEKFPLLEMMIAEEK